MTMKEMNIKKHFETKELVVNGNGSITGSLTVGGGVISSGVINENIEISAGYKIKKGTTIDNQLAKTATYPITDTDPDILVTGALGADATITLPTLADNQGRTITVVIGVTPGHNVIVDGEGGETINGATTKTNATAYSYLRLFGTPMEWLIIGSVGTWT